jgi:tungstate transport system permease protein
VKFFWDGLKQAIDLLLHPDAALLKILEVTFQVALWATLVALVIGLPLGLALALGRFRGRRALLALANAGLGLPPVVIGLICALMFFRGAPLGSLDLIYSLKGVIVAQTLLALPVVVALTASAVQAVPTPLLDQARALGASTLQVCGLALREARIGVFAAGIAALGSALSEVGAVVLVGGNIQGQTQTLASATLLQVGAGEYGRAMALGIILLGLIVVIGGGLTIAQQREAQGALRRAS